jgi:membrane-associated protein
MYDVAGEAIWIFGYGGLGYLFGTEWEVVSDFISNFGGLMLGLVVLVAGFLLALRRLRPNSARADDNA